MERLLPKREKFLGSYFQKLIMNLKRPLNKIKYLKAIKRLHHFLKDEEEEIHNISQTIDSVIYSKEKKTGNKSTKKYFLNKGYKTIIPFSKICRLEHKP